jgi:two-component system response regulator MprA
MRRDEFEQTQYDKINPGNQAMATALIVDDDLKLLKMLQRTLTYEGLQIITASNGEEALAQVDACQPDIIILDWMMPKMDGLSVVQRLRVCHDQTFILMLTARDALENRVEGLESGADDYLVKPFAPAELVARVHAMLRRIENKPARQPVAFEELSLDRLPARPISRAHPDRIRAAPLLLTPPAPGARAQANFERRLGLRFRRG